MPKTKVQTSPATVRYFAHPQVSDQPTDHRSFLAAVAAMLAKPLMLAHPVAVSVSGRPCLAERVNPLTWRLSYRNEEGEVKHRFVQTTSPDRLATEALRVATDLAADLGVGFANVAALATV